MVTTLAAVAGIYAAYEARPKTIANRAAEVLLNSKTDEVMELAQAIMPRGRASPEISRSIFSKILVRTWSSWAREAAARPRACCMLSPAKRACYASR